MKLRRTKRMPAAAKRKLRAKRLAQAKRFLREHTWGVMITVLILIALVLFVFIMGINVVLNVILKGGDRDAR